MADTESAQAVAQGDEDLELVLEFKDGSRSAFNRLVLKYQDPIMNLCVRMTGDRASGSDAAQDTFVKAYKNLHTFREQAVFSTWLYTIAVNTCRNVHRSWWRRIFSTSAPAEPREDEETGRVSGGVADRDLQPDQVLERKRRIRKIEGAMNTLPPKHREMIILRDIEGRDYEEIAGITGSSLGTVKSRLNRAREAMRNQLKELRNET